MTDLFAQPEIVAAEAQPIIERAENVFELLKLLEFPARVHAINQIRLALHRLSPFASEPVDCVQWINADEIAANDYNPNSVAPPEMKLLEHSITEDGYREYVPIETPSKSPLTSWAYRTRHSGDSG